MGHEPNVTLGNAAMESDPLPSNVANWGALVTQALDQGNESEVSAIDPGPNEGVSDDALHPAYGGASETEDEEGCSESRLRELLLHLLGTVSCRGWKLGERLQNGLLGRASGKGEAADDEELVPDYSKLPATVEGHVSMQEMPAVVGTGMFPAAAMDVDPF